MNMTKTLEALRERRDFYAAAITALEKVAAYEQRTPSIDIPQPRTAGSGNYKRTPAMRARMAAAQRARWAKLKANGADHDVPVTSAPEPEPVAVQ